MQLAAHTDDACLALMTMASCQVFYDEFTTEYNIERVRLFEGFQIDDLVRSAKLFDAAIAAFEKAHLECE